MTLDFFYKNYDLKALEVKSVEIKSNKLLIDVFVSAHLDLVANGYRPELDVMHEILFTFNLNKENKKYNNPVIKDVSYDGNLYINVNGDSLIITENEVTVTQRI